MPLAPWSGNAGGPEQSFRSPTRRLTEWPTWFRAQQEVTEFIVALELAQAQLVALLKEAQRALSATQGQGVTLVKEVNRAYTGGHATTAGAEDSFQRANEKPLSKGGVWKEISGQQTLGQILEESYAPEPPFSSGAYWSTSTFSGAETVQVELHALHTIERGPLIYTCLQAPATAPAGYRIEIEATVTVGEYFVLLEKWSVAAGATVLKTFTLALKAGDTLGIRVTGGKVQLFKNGSLVGEAEDATYTEGYAGIGFRGSAEVWRLRNFQVGSSGVVAGQPQAATLGHTTTRAQALSATQAQAVTRKTSITALRTLTQAQAPTRTTSITTTRSLTQGQTATRPLTVARAFTLTQAQAVTRALTPLRILSAAQAQALTRSVSIATTRSLTQAQAITRALTPLRALSAGQAQTATLLRAWLRVLSVEQASSPTFDHPALTRAFALTQAQALARTTSISTTRALTQGQAPTEGTSQTRTLALEASQAVTRTISPTRVLASAQSAGASFARAVLRILALSGTGEPTLEATIIPGSKELHAEQGQGVRAFHFLVKSLVTTQLQSAEAAHQTTTIRSATAGSLASFGRALVRFLRIGMKGAVGDAHFIARTFVADGASAASAARGRSQTLAVGQGSAVTRSLALLRTFAHAQGAAGTLRHPALSTTRAVTQGQRASYTTAQTRELLAGDGQSATVATSKTHTFGLEAGATSAALLGFQLLRVLPSSSSSSATMRHPALTRTIALRCSLYAALGRPVSRRFMATSGSTASLTRGAARGLTLSQSQTALVGRVLVLDLRVAAVALGTVEYRRHRYVGTSVQTLVASASTGSASSVEITHFTAAAQAGELIASAASASASSIAVTEFDSDVQSGSLTSVALSNSSSRVEQE